MRLLAPAIFLLLGATLLGQATSGPIDVQSILQGLQDIKQKQADSSRHQLSQTISDFTAASSDDGAALNFYVEAVRVTRFVGRSDADSAFDLWRKTVVPRLNPAAIRTALRYTTLSVQRAAGGTDDQIFPLLFAYADDTQNQLPALLARPPSAPTGQPPNMQRGEHHGYGERNGPGGFGGGFGGFGGGEPDPDENIMQQDVSANIFSRWYDLGSHLSSLENWEMVPANTDNMYQKFLLPIMRRNRDPRVLTYWDNRIIFERGAASAATADFTTDHYNSTVRPSLLWNRAEDEIAIGQRDKGITDMYALLKAFPGHPDAGKWIPELEGLLTAPPAVAAGGTVPASPH
jgi:hypothetical protein